MPYYHPKGGLGFYSTRSKKTYTGNRFVAKRALRAYVERRRYKAIKSYDGYQKHMKFYGRRR